MDEYKFNKCERKKWAQELKEVLQLAPETLENFPRENIRPKIVNKGPWKVALQIYVV